MELLSTLVSIFVILILLYKYLKDKTLYWKNLGVPFVKPDLLIGNLRGVATKCHAGERWQSCYNELKNRKSPIGGVFFLTAPVALDLDLLRNVFVKDFQHFRNHGNYVNERDDPLSAHMFSVTDDKWRNLRTKLSPTFTSGKMKMMYPTIKSVADQFAENLKMIVTKCGEEVELKEVLCQFSVDVIGSTAFGIQCNTIKDPNGELRNITKRMFAPSKVTSFKQILLMQFPEIGRKLRIKLIDSQVTTFIMKLVGGIVKHREKDPTAEKRNDFMSLLLQLKDTGSLEGDQNEMGKITFNEVAAQMFLFFFAGFETSSSTMTFAFYELAMNPEVQKRARAEISEVLKRHDGQMTYEAALELTYIDQIIQETLRKYPIVDTLFRKVSIPYKVPGTSVVLAKDSVFLIPVLGIHRDPDIYPEPEKFDPDRFTKENIAERHPYAWIPFGKGPRDCIGMRFGMMQSRLGLATVIQNFQVNPTSRTPAKLKIAKDAQVMAPAGGMYLNLIPV